MILWKKENNQEKLIAIENKIINILQSVDTKICDHYQVLVLATSFEFKAAIVYIFEHNKQLSEIYPWHIFYNKPINYICHFRYTKLIRYYLSMNDYISAINCCRRYGHVEPKLWVSVFNTAMVDENFPSYMLEEILKEIGVY